MADSKRKPRRLPVPDKSLARLAPLALFLLALLVLWSASVYAMRSIEWTSTWPRQVYPLVLWSGAIVFWIFWQKPPRPAHWLGLAPVSRLAIGASVLAFVVVVAWSFVRVSLSRTPGDLLGEIPPEIYIWLVLGVFLNELLFRGLVLARLTEAFDPAIAIPLAAFAAVVFRIPSYFTTGVPVPFDPMVLIGVFLLGLVAGLLRHFCRSLWPAVALHWGNSLGSLL